MKTIGQVDGSLRTLLVLVSALAAMDCNGAVGDDQIPSVSLSLDVQDLVPAEYKMIEHKKLLFASSRKIVNNSDEVARLKQGGSVNYEKVFLASLSPSIAYGWVEVGFPSDRKFGEQNYNPDPTKPNPFSYFSIESFGMVGTRQAAQRLVEDQGFDKNERALVFVHGISNTFSDSAERLTQMVVDLNVKGTPVLFSWPSETGAPVVSVTPESYRRALRNARTSEPYLAQAVSDILSSPSEHFDIIAHSMGTLVTFDVMRLKPPKGFKLPPPPPMLPNIVLAAPDIGMKHFAAGREDFVKKARRLTVYCGRDVALFFSKQVNGDERLGYCSDAMHRKDLIEGVEFVRVYGNFRDVFAHSYFINTPQVVRDIRSALSTNDATEITNAVRPPYREIFLDY
jgi:esterase/lipase superfamily enzyme